MNILAFLAGLGAYVVFAVPFGLAVFGVGFAPEPQKTIGSYVIVLAPLVPAGLVAGFLARSSPVPTAAAVAFIALLVFWALAPGPMPWLMPAEHTNLVAAQGAYQARLYIGLGSAAGWAGAAMNRRHRA